MRLSLRSWRNSSPSATGIKSVSIRDMTAARFFSIHAFSYSFLWDSRNSSPSIKSATQSSKKRTVEEEEDAVTGDPGKDEGERKPFALELTDSSAAMTSLEEEKFIVFVKEMIPDLYRVLVEKKKDDGFE